MSEKKKSTVGKQFVKLLENVSDNKEKLLDLASAVIKHSPSRRGLKSRDLPDDETAVKMKASIAKFNALAGKDVSTDGMLAMIANTNRQKNFGSPLQFKKDFQKKHHAEFVNNTEKNILLTARNRGTVND